MSRMSNATPLRTGLDVLAILRAFHETATEVEHLPETTRFIHVPRNVTRRAEVEPVAYLFRRSGDTQGAER